jgi:hypothetical protein
LNNEEKIIKEKLNKRKQDNRKKLTKIAQHYSVPQDVRVKYIFRSKGVGIRKKQNKTCVFLEKNYLTTVM